MVKFPSVAAVSPLLSVDGGEGPFAVLTYTGEVRGVALYPRRPLYVHAVIYFFDTRREIMRLTELSDIPTALAIYSCVP